MDRKKLLLLLLAFLLLTTLNRSAEAKTVTFHVGQNILVSDGEIKIMEVKPYIKNGRVYLPVRYIAESIGITPDWDLKTKTVYLFGKNRTVRMQVGSKQMLLDNITVNMDASPEIFYNRVMLPVRWVTEAFGLKVGWNPDTKSIILEDSVVENTEKKLSTSEIIELARPAVVLIKTSRGQGSGFFWSTDGEVITNAHVVAGSSDIKIFTYNGLSYNAHIEKADAIRDIAILRVEGGGPFTIIPHYSMEYEQGEEVVAIGSPLGLQDSASKGIISAIRDISEVDPRKRNLQVIQTDANVLPGSSGCPLLNMRGELIGIVFGGKGEGLGINFALPIINYFSVASKQDYGVKDDLLLYLEEEDEWFDIEDQVTKLMKQATSYLESKNITGAIDTLRQLVNVLEELQTKVASYQPQTRQVNDLRSIKLSYIKNYYLGFLKYLEFIQLISNPLTASAADLPYYEGNNYLNLGGYYSQQYWDAKKKLNNEVLQSN